MHCKLFHDWADVWTISGDSFIGDEPPDEVLWQINCLRCGKIKEKKVTT